MQKAARIEVIKDGGGPLFPGTNFLANPQLSKKKKKKNQEEKKKKEKKKLLTGLPPKIGTFVPIPFSQRSKNPLDLARYQWWRLKSYAQCVLSVLTIKLRSMPSWTTRPQWKAHRAQIAPTARAMYREMLEAYAAGDKATVARLCMPRFAKQLHAAMDRRSAAETVRFEYVKNTRALVYPRIASHLIHAINPYDKTVLTEQAVVAVSSQQQVSRHRRDDGAVVPGSLRVQDKIEYVVLARATDTKTYPSTQWRIWGTTGGTTAEAYQQEQAVILKETAHRAGWKDKV